MLVRTTQKDGNDPDENEDRAAFGPDGGGMRLAVADGATESSFSDRWADALVRHAVSSPWPEIFAPRGLARAREAFEESLPAREELPWYAAEKLAQGSHAAMAVLRLEEGPAAWRWRAASVGDCQIFVLRPGPTWRVIRSFPAAEAAQFGFHPGLVPTCAAAWPGLPVQSAVGTVRAPFELWLVSDALAHACLLALEAGRPAWAVWAEASSTDEAFEAAVASARSRRAMRNDDVTMVRVWQD